MLKIKAIISLIINFFIPKRKNRIYLRGRLIYPRSKCDLFNYGASNAYTFLHEYFLTHKARKKVKIYIEHGDMSRLNEYEEYILKAQENNFELIFLDVNRANKSRLKYMFRRMMNAVKRFSCKTWLCESGDTFSVASGKLPSQKVISFNYFISCKNDLIIDKNFRCSFVEGMLTTSLLASQVLSSATGVKLDKCQILGFPRNDVLFQTDKKEKILSWISEKLGYKPETIILYAPTYRDYESEKKAPVFHSENKINSMDSDSIKERQMLGYPCDGLEQFIKDNKIAFIYNLHRLQQVDVINKDCGMIAYEENYDFTLYDLMSVVDCLISDYSSISYDFLLLDRPLIFNLYDFEKYNRLRGVSYDPFEEFCPGDIVNNWEEMKVALENVIAKKDGYKEHRARVCKLLHKYPDGKSTERVMEYFDNYLHQLLKK